MGIMHLYKRLMPFSIELDDPDLTFATELIVCHYFNIKAYNMMWQSQPIQPSRPSLPMHITCNKAGMLGNDNNYIRSHTLHIRSHIANSSCYEGSCRHITRRQELRLSLLHL